MWTCNRVRGLLAASLYETLDAGDQRLLERHLGECGGCRAEAESLGHLVESIPVDGVELGEDLLPLVRLRLDETGAGAGGGAARFGEARWAFGAVAAGLLVVLGLWAVTLGPPNGAPGPEVEVAGVAITPLEATLEEVDGLIGARNFTGAYLALEEGLAAYGDDDRAAVALARMGDIAYTELRWYGQAHEAYRRLQQEYFGTFRASPEHVLRLNVLADARKLGEDYGALHQLDQARLTERFEDFETVAGRYPGTFVASLAAEDMARLAAGDVLEQDGSVERARAYELALAQCSNPIAAAQLKMALGDHLSGEGGDVDRARTLYRDVVESGTGALARLAEDSLSRLGDSGR